MSAPSCHWWDGCLQSWCAGERGEAAYDLTTIQEVPACKPCPYCGATLPVCATCLQRRKRTGDCRIGHKTRPEPCREYLLDRRKKRG